MNSTILIPAAQYLRRSTEHQQYSLENQSRAIEAYATMHGYSIVKTYSDSGRSGLVLRNRFALQRLIRDVVQGNANYRTVLVFDVSRWGRFQDTDEAACYEFLCRSAGVAVHYCGETFENDGSLPSAVMKSLKRVMAGEYSRELGRKIYEGQKNLARLGFRQGAHPGYGFRRLLVGGDGTPKHPLADGERKSIQTDRVRLIRGPEHEVRCVQEIYAMFLQRKMSFWAIAKELNQKNVPFVRGLKWSHRSVGNILTHPKYAGVFIYGRMTQRLHTPPTRTPESQWTVVPGALDALVPPEMFAKVQEVIAKRPWNKSNEVLIEDLRKAIEREGKITCRTVSKTGQSDHTYRHRFGSMARAYELAGYRGRWSVQSTASARKARELRRELMEKIVAASGGRITIAEQGPSKKNRLKMSNGSNVSLLICRCFRSTTRAVRWLVRSRPSECHLLTVIARLDELNTTFKDFYVLPPTRVTTSTVLRERDPRLCQGIQVTNLPGLAAAIGKVGRRRVQTWRRTLEMIRQQRRG